VVCRETALGGGGFFFVGELMLPNGMMLFFMRRVELFDYKKQ
jgi:hypothetical protein